MKIRKKMLRKVIHMISKTPRVTLNELKNQAAQVGKSSIWVQHQECCIRIAIMTGMLKDGLYFKIIPSKPY